MSFGGSRWNNGYYCGGVNACQLFPSIPIGTNVWVGTEGENIWHGEFGGIVDCTLLLTNGTLVNREHHHGGGYSAGQGGGGGGGSYDSHRFNVIRIPIANITFVTY